jgi:hypothetical protein
MKEIISQARATGQLRDPGIAAPVPEKNADPAAFFKGLKSVWADVTPAMAKRWLENNFRNRPLVEDVVAAYARDMVNGVWVPTHQGIAFSDKDELIDGQHRLHAIVRSGVTIRMMVTFGIPAKIEGSEMTTMDAVDRGRTRSVADQLKIQHGLDNGSIIAAVCTSLGYMCYGERTRRLSVGQALEIYRAFENPIQWVIVHRPRAHGLRATGVLAGFSFALAVDPSFVDGSTGVSIMFENLVSGENLAQGSPILALRNFLISDQAKLLTRSNDRGLTELTCWAIWLEQLGQKEETLKVTPEGVDHFRNLQKARVDKIAAMFRLPGGSKH